MSRNRPVEISAFAEHVEKSSKDDNAIFSKEFDLLKKVCKHHSTEVALSPVNRNKNRYVKLPAFDHNRVKLHSKGQEGSDYINANYMTGFISLKEYIATQGPLVTTRNEFWRMIWEQHIEAIVMLTRCFDKDVEKCNPYWPEDVQVPCKYGDITVDIVKKTIEKEWTISEMVLTRGDATRNVTHFHFTAWPDYGTPSKPETIINFMKLVQENFQRGVRPLVVHCSAGIGRTGTFLTLDIVKQQVENRNYVDVFGAICQIRDCRMEMVETLDQYIFVHKVVEELLKQRQIKE